MDKLEKFGRIQPYMKRVDMNYKYTPLNDIYMYMQGAIDIDNGNPIFSQVIIT